MVVINMVSSRLRVESSIRITDPRILTNGLVDGQGPHRRLVSSSLTSNTYTRRLRIITSHTMTSTLAQANALAATDPTQAETLYKSILANKAGES